MSERGLNHLAGGVRPFRRPVPEARSELMRHGCDAEFFDQFRQRHVGERLPAWTAEHQTGAIAQSPGVEQDRERPPSERDPVTPLHLQRNFNYLILRDYNSADATSCPQDCPKSEAVSANRP